MIEGHKAVHMMVQDVEKWLSKIELAISQEQHRVQSLETELSESRAALEREYARSEGLEEDMRSLAAAARTALELISALEAKAGKTFDTGEALRAALPILERRNIAA